MVDAKLRKPQVSSNSNRFFQLRKTFQGTTHGKLKKGGQKRFDKMNGRLAKIKTKPWKQRFVVVSSKISTPGQVVFASLVLASIYIDIDNDKILFLRSEENQL